MRTAGSWRCGSTLANVGAYISSERNLLATFSNVGTLTGVYDIRAAHVSVLAVMANTNGTAPYRGAGRPEATYVIERLIDDAARELGLDRVELRARNLIPREKIPYRTALALNYDSGDFPANQKKALALADWDGFAARRDEAGSAANCAASGSRTRSRRRPRRDRNLPKSAFTRAATSPC